MLEHVTNSSVILGSLSRGSGEEGVTVLLRLAPGAAEWMLPPGLGLWVSRDFDTGKRLHRCRDPLCYLSMPVWGHTVRLNINSKERDPLLIPGPAVFWGVCPSAQDFVWSPAFFHSRLPVLKCLTAFLDGLGKGRELADPRPSGLEKVAGTTTAPRAEPGNGLQEKLPLTSAESEILWGTNECSK